MYILYVDVDVEPMIVRLSTLDVQQAGLEKGRERRSERRAGTRYIRITYMWAPRRRRLLSVDVHYSLFIDIVGRVAAGRMRNAWAPRRALAIS